MSHSSAIIEANYIFGNCFGDGCSAAVETGSSNTLPTIRNNYIVNNNARGISALSYAAPTITRNFVIGNKGAGICCDTNRKWLSVTDNFLIGNRGSGLHIANEISPEAEFSGNVIYGNTSDNSGAGIEIYNASPTIRNNTVVGNYSAQRGAGIYVSSYNDDAEPVVTNTIVWGNDAPLGQEIYVNHIPGYSVNTTLTISYSNVEWGLDSVSVGEACSLSWGEGMIDEDPLFVLPEKQDLRLLWESPCIDTGDPNLFDADGTRSDMGGCIFDQDDYLTLYLTPDTRFVPAGEELGVTYTAINRWPQPEPFWLLSEVLLPGGAAFTVLGPNQYSLPADATVQVHVEHPVPQAMPVGMCRYQSEMSDTEPGRDHYDVDGFKFWVIEQQ